MLRRSFCLWMAALMAASTVVVAFAPVSVVRTPRVSSSSVVLSMALDAPPPALVDAATVRQSTTVAASSPTNSLLDRGIQEYVSESSSTVTLSLVDRAPPPTAEEIAAKKRNFNLWFWGGGFVAPFLATFYYFGFKFWEK